MSLSTVLKNRRKELGLTLNDIAQQMGVSEATVQRWESGNIKSLRQGRIAQLAEILNVSPSALMGWDNASNAATEINELKLDNTYLRLARGAQELGLDDDDVDAILAIYKKHKQKNS